MLQKTPLIILLISSLFLGVLGQTFSEKYWKELADHSKVIIVGTVEEEHRVGRPEKLKLSPDNPNPSERDIYVGMVFRLKITDTLKGKIKAEKDRDNKYIYVFTYWATGTPSWSDPIIFKGKEYVLFLEPNNDKKLEGIGTIEFKKPNYEIITKPFDYKSSYLVVDGFTGAVEIKGDKKKLIKEIKKSF